MPHTLTAHDLAVHWQYTYVTQPQYKVRKHGNIRHGPRRIPSNLPFALLLISYLGCLPGSCMGSGVYDRLVYVARQPVCT